MKLYEITCSRDSDCFRVYVQDPSALAAFGPMMAEGCPSCKARLAVGSAEVRIGTPFGHNLGDSISSPSAGYATTSDPGILKALESLRAGPVEVSGASKWPLSGPYPDVNSVGGDSGSRNRLLGSNTPHFLVSQAATGALAGLLEEQGSSEVSLDDFREHAADALAVVRRELVNLENEAGVTRNERPSSGFPRHVDERTPVMLRSGSPKRRPTDILPSDRAKKSRNRFQNTVIGGFRKDTGEPYGALYEQGLIALTENDEGLVSVGLTAAGKELSSFENILLHGPPAIEHIEAGRRYPSEMSEWLIEHTFSRLRSESDILSLVYSRLRSKPYYMDGLVGEMLTNSDVRGLELGARRPGAAKRHISALIQRWRVVGLFRTSRDENRKTTYMVNDEFEHLDYLESWIAHHRGDRAFWATSPTAAVGRSLPHRPARRGG